jgi:hypothetical protein
MRAIEQELKKHDWRHWSWVFFLAGVFIFIPRVHQVQDAPIPFQKCNYRVSSKGVIHEPGSSYYSMVRYAVDLCPKQARQISEKIRGNFLSEQHEIKALHQ